MSSEDVIVRNAFFIGGEWVEPAGENTLDVTAAHTGQVIGRVPEGVVADVDAAVAAARHAFDHGPWPSMSPEQRSELLNKFADNVESKAEEYARLTTAQNGSTIGLTLGMNLPWGVNVVRHFAKLACETDYAAPRDCTNANATLRKVPVGVAVAIIPFNVPFISAMAKTAHAVAAGCTVIVKPSPDTPLEAFMIAEAANEAGIPAGVINVIVANIEASQHLVSHPDIDVVSFTGSTAVGKQIASICGANLKRCSMELGGNAASIILDDMPLEPILPGLLGTSMLLANGQACIAQSRIMVSRARYDECVNLLKAAIEQIVVGDPNDPQVQLGPMVSEAHMNRILSQIDDAVKEGARLVIGGKRATDLPDELNDGFFVEPTMLADVTPDMNVSQVEIFGPVIRVIAYDSVEEAVEIANNQPYGLSSSVWSMDGEKATNIGQQIQAGNMYINGAMALDANVPFLGVKDSGLGLECGTEGLHEFLDYQALYTPKA